MPQDNRGQAMPTWLRSLVNAFLSKVPGKISRLDTATRMMMDADFSPRREVPRETRPTVIRTPVNKRNLKDQNRCAVCSRPRSSVLHGKLPQRSPTAAMIITKSIRPVTWCILSAISAFETVRGFHLGRISGSS
jgi:hypothetical protein